MKFMSIWCIIRLIVLAMAAETALGAPKKSTMTKASKERIAALYIKDSESGELRFLTDTGNGDSNQALDDFITQKQDLLEQLRPSTGSTGITPIVVSLGNGAITSTGVSPIGDLLPQIIAQAISNQRRRPNRNGIRRRVVNNNNSHRPGNYQIYIIRPGNQ